MSMYYVYMYGVQTGPHTIEEIKAMNFSDDNLIWNHHFPSWINANEFVAAHKSVSLTPPPLPVKEFNEVSAIKKALLDSTIPFIIILIMSFLYFDGFASNYELEQMYPAWGYMGGSTIRNITCGISLIIAVIPTLIYTLVDYRMRIIREAKRLRLGLVEYQPEFEAI